MPDIKAARQRTHGSHATVHQARQLRRARGRLERRQLVHEVHRQRELHESLDIQEEFEPWLVGSLGKIGVTRRGRPPFTQRDELVKR